MSFLPDSESVDESVRGAEYFVEVTAHKSGGKVFTLYPADVTIREVPLGNPLQSPDERRFEHDGAAEGKIDHLKVRIPLDRAGYEALLGGFVGHKRLCELLQSEERALAGMIKLYSLIDAKERIIPT